MYRCYSKVKYNICSVPGIPTKVVGAQHQAFGTFCFQVRGIYSQRVQVCNLMPSFLMVETWDDKSEVWWGSIKTILWMKKKVLWTSFTMYKKILYFLIIKLLEIRFKNSLKAKFGFLVNFILKTGSQNFFLKTTKFNNLTHIDVPHSKIIQKSFYLHFFSWSMQHWSKPVL